MTEERIARILYNMNLDMDYADYLDLAEEEISILTKEIHDVYEKHISLFNVLENIALQNEDMEFWKERVSK